MKKLLTILLLLSCSAFGQSYYVSIAGNSIAQFQAPFAPEEFPSLDSNLVHIWGQPSAPCSCFNATQNGVPLIYSYVPAQTTVAVLIDSTNDLGTLSANDQVNCVKQTITYLLNRNPNLKIVVANTPPWTHYNPCTQQNNDDAILAAIRAYNVAYVSPTTGFQAAFPNNARVADVYTPAAQSDGWANTSLMIGPCGIHPGNQFQWSFSWGHFATPYVQLVLAAINGQW